MKVGELIMVLQGMDSDSEIVLVVDDPDGEVEDGDTLTVKPNGVIFQYGKGNIIGALPE